MRFRGSDAGAKFWVALILDRGVREKFKGNAKPEFVPVGFRLFEVGGFAATRSCFFVHTKTIHSASDPILTMELQRITYVGCHHVTISRNGHRQLRRAVLVYLQWQVMALAALWRTGARWGTLTRRCELDGCGWRPPTREASTFAKNDGENKWWVDVGTKKWMVYSWKSFEIGCLGGTPIFGNFRVRITIIKLCESW